MGGVTPTGADGSAPESVSAIEWRDAAIRALMQRIRENVEILRALRPRRDA